MFFDNHKFTSYLASWRFMKSFAPAAPDPSVEKWLRGRIDNAFGIAERHLAKREYVVGSNPPLPTCRCAATCTFRRRRAATTLRRSTRRWRSGWNGSSNCRDGSRLTRCCRESRGAALVIRRVLPKPNSTAS